MCSYFKCVKDNQCIIYFPCASCLYPLCVISLAAHCLEAVLQSAVCYRMPLNTAYPNLMCHIKLTYIWCAAAVYHLWQWNSSLTRLWEQKFGLLTNHWGRNSSLCNWTYERGFCSFIWTCALCSKSDLATLKSCGRLAALYIKHWINICAYVTHFEHSIWRKQSKEAKQRSKIPLESLHHQA